MNATLLCVADCEWYMSSEVTKESGWEVTTTKFTIQFWKQTSLHLIESKKSCRK